MKLPIPSKQTLFEALLALPVALLPSNDGMSLCNVYFKIGFPFREGVTIYGPGSGLTGISMPSLVILALDFAFWFLLANSTLKLWRWTRTRKAAPAPVALDATICFFWELLIICSVLGVGRFLLEYRWSHMTDSKCLMHSLRLTAAIFPAFCLGLFALPFIIQLLLSRPYPPRLRILHCTIPLVWIILVSLPFNTIRWSGESKWRPTILPILYFAETGAALSSLADAVAEDVN